MDIRAKICWVLHFVIKWNISNNKTFKKIDILKALAQPRYEARSYYLLTLTNSSIRNTTEYGAAILNTVCDTIFKNLEILQTIAIRTALNLPNWVPNVLLHLIMQVSLLSPTGSALLPLVFGSSTVL